MPWNKNNTPNVAKNLTDKQKEVFVAAANAALASGKSEGQAIAIRLAAAKKDKKMNKSVKIEIDADKLTEDGKAGFLHDFISMLESWFSVSSATEREGGDTYELEMMKSVDQEQRRAMFVVLEPDTVDLHGDTYSAEEIEKACANFNLHCMKANLFHRVQTEDAVIEQSFISPATFKLEDGREIKKGTWLMWYHFPKDNERSEAIWKMVKDNQITGVSVGCTARVEELE